MSQERIWNVPRLEPQAGNGGTSHVLPAERAKATFDFEQMSEAIYGDKAAVLRRRFILDGNAKTNPENFVHEEVPRDELVRRGIANFMDVHIKYFRSGYRMQANDMTSMFDARTVFSGVTNSWGMFLSTLISMCSDEQKSWWVQRTIRGEMIGCYSQTELGHGSNLRGLRTVARYDPETEEFVINTPSLQATKWWATGLPCATHALVAAQLDTDGIQHGMHFFMVQLRADNLKPMPGVRLGDVGSLAGGNSTPIGFLQLDNVRLPRRALLERLQHVTKSGEYVMGPPAEAMKKKDAGAARLDPKMRQTLTYITMLKTRIGLSTGAAGALSKACTIAARYSCVRHQGFMEPSSAKGNAESERQVIDYGVQRFRILKWIATAYSYRAATNWMLNCVNEAMAGEDTYLNDLPELHASTSGLKALSCVVAADGIEDLRRACGGHGFLNSAGLAPIEAGFKGPNTSGEGDYVLLSLQTARFLIKSLRAAYKGEPLSGLTNCLAPLKNLNFDPSKRDLSAIPVATTADQMAEPVFLQRLFEARTVAAIARAGDMLERDINERGLLFDEAWNSNSRALYTATRCHVRYFILNKFINIVNSVKDPACKAAMHKLCSFYALVDLIEGESWVGIVERQEMDLAEQAVDSLSAALRPDVIALTDAFGFEDRSLNSAIGKHDGNVYETLFKEALRSGLNMDANGNAIDVPVFWDALKPYIDTDNLKIVNGKQILPASAAKL